ncbi:GNAT family N-acetyltransferase [Microbacterium sp. NC79]|uniref:GNAT family N-acetyltransferase n=1 Tax=Microbacterium sp. NC79 TaxID=2851009 RepID=UPI001C2B7DA5|nr:GNAT family N-acetyltransferase [Microbacterium sp. NC79]MBV0893783.1 N-acetyltransferase [Microbacterium sp. NC79]
MTDETTTETTLVRRNEEAGRYEILVDDVVAGFTEFTERQGAFLFPHTEIDPAFGGRGLGSTLVAGAMADSAARGDTVVPLCPFVVKYLRGHDVPGLTISWPPRHES